MTNFLNAKWENLIMANYSIGPEILLPYLPKGTELDYHDGKTFVSLVGFLFRDTRIFGLPIPFLGTFEEINLRFYVTRKVGSEVRRGVVFVNETVPNRFVAWVANYLYKEHYVAVPTTHDWTVNENVKRVKYQWINDKEWKSIYAEAQAINKPLIVGSEEEFIFEHYYGYTRVDERTSEEYAVQHPRWNVNDVTSYQIDCNFETMYGKDFAFLNNVKPDSVFLAEGSTVSVKWKRNRFV
ncbi:YqjF family protein [Dyadobacter arcticus]|uniref:DUF2071 domain-containing protein n=1 Tax=Dyadobacter arcticus TaxID=1078754 RepID=A0ABX0US31_9BACT|nr:DUF2071 domain-containing protein [Dyadobacter arcticus]NIJ54445.1 hypothetical protein [Dyadobacter arcticus]